MSNAIDEVIVSPDPPHYSITAEEIASAIAKRTSSDKPKPYFTLVTAAELAAKDTRQAYLIKGVLAEHQLGLMGGHPKTLKTGNALDAAVSLATGLPFLGHFEVPEPKRVLVLSGESGEHTIKETCNRICAAKSQNLSQPITLASIGDALVISEQVPSFSSPTQMSELQTILKEHSFDVVILDPAYLALDGENQNNVFAMGSQLKLFAELAIEASATPIIIHHTRKQTTNGSEFQPLELADLSGAGFAEFARQWILISRRQRYVEGTGDHHFWMTIGGSAGHSGCWAVDIAEGSPDDETGRRWEVNVALPSDAKAKAAEDAERRRVEKKRAQEQNAIQGNCEKVVSAFRGVRPARLTKTAIKDRAGLSGASANLAIAYMLRIGQLKDGFRVKAPNGQEYDGYELQIEAPTE